MRSRSLTYKKTLILLCDNYPLSAGEFFIDDEMRVIAPQFEKVIVTHPAYQPCTHLSLRCCDEYHYPIL